MARRSYLIACLVARNVILLYSLHLSDFSPLELHTIIRPITTVSHTSDSNGVVVEGNYKETSQSLIIAAPIFTIVHLQHNITIASKPPCFIISTRQGYGVPGIKGKLLRQTVTKTLTALKTLLGLWEACNIQIRGCALWYPGG